jgi:hypothetical protein
MLVDELATGEDELAAACRALAAHLGEAVLELTALAEAHEAAAERLRASGARRDGGWARALERVWRLLVPGGLDVDGALVRLRDRELAQARAYLRLDGAAPDDQERRALRRALVSGAWQRLLQAERILAAREFGEGLFA